MTTMDDAPESKAGPVSLIVISAVIALACASSIGAIATLVVMTLDRPASVTTVLAGDVTVSGPSKPRNVTVRPVLAPQNADCVVAAWKTGTIYCFLDMPDEGNRPSRIGPAVVVQAQAEKPTR